MIDVNDLRPWRNESPIAGGNVGKAAADAEQHIRLFDFLAANGVPYCPIGPTHNGWSSGIELRPLLVVTIGNANIDASASSSSRFNSTSATVRPLASKNSTSNTPGASYFHHRADLARRQDGRPAKVLRLDINL
jgi:hypothetical protein